MPRPRSPNRDKAREMYLKSKGNTKLTDIAEKLGLKPSQIRKWKSIDKWDDQLKGALPKTKSNVTKKEHKKPTRKEKEMLEKLEDAELTEKQRLFCLYYVKAFNATMAAMKAGYSKDTAHVIGCENLKKPKIAKEIKRLKGTMTQDIFIDALDVLSKYVKIAFADITDYIEFGQRKEQVIGQYGPIYKGKGEEKEPVMQTVNYIDLKSSNELDGTIITEVGQGRDGIKIKLADKMKALEKLEKYFDLIPDKWKRKIEEEKIALAKLKAGEDAEEEQTDDGFIEALKGKVKEVWADEK